MKNWSWAFKRRLNILLLIAGALISFVIVPYYLTHIEQPTCFDGKQNQNEEGIDCGGGCVLLCKGAAQDLKVIWKRVIETRPGIAEAAFFVENGNFNVGAQSIPYTVTLYDASGEQIATRKGKTYAGSNEQFLILEGNFVTGAAHAARAEIVFSEFPWITTDVGKNVFTVVEKVLTNFDTRPKLTAQIRNDSPVDEQNVEVAAVISDDTGNVVGYSKTFVDRVGGGETVPVVFTWPSAFTYEAGLESCDTTADIALLIDRSGSMQSQGKNPPEPLTTVQNAASTFIAHLHRSDQVAIVSFATDASDPIDHVLTMLKEDVKKSMLSIEIGKKGIQYTNTGAALLAARRELSSLRHNKDASRVIVLLTDGEAGEPNWPENPEDPDYAKKYALDIAKQAKTEGIALYTIGLGVNANADFLRQLSSTPDYYFAAPSASDLDDIYQKIGMAICKKAPSVIQVLPRVNNVRPI